MRDNWGLAILITAFILWTGGGMIYFSFTIGWPFWFITAGVGFLVWVVKLYLDNKGFQ